MDKWIITSGKSIVSSIDDNFNVQVSSTEAPVTFDSIGDAMRACDKCNKLVNAYPYKVCRFLKR